MPINTSFEYLNYNYNNISDEYGEVLLYKDSYFIYNKDGLVLNDSISLLSAVFSGASVILPDHEFEGQYFILNIDGETGMLNSCKIEMNETDSTLFIPEDECNIILEDDYVGYSPERLSIVKHGNGKDWWVITKVHVLLDSLQPFSVRQFSNLEFNEPALYYTDSILDSYYFQSGRMVISEDGSKIAIENGKDIKIYTFDRCSGEVLFDCQIPIIPNYLLKNISFSQTGNFLYVASEGADLGGINGISKIWQFDIGGSSTCEELEASKQLVYEEPESYYG